GAAGSINPVRDTSGFEDVARYGLTLAGATLQLLGRMGAPEYPTEMSRVGFAHSTVSLPSRPVPPLAPLEAALREARAQCAAPPPAWEEGGYEVGLGMWTRAGPEAFGLLLEAGQQLVRRLDH